MKKYLLPVALDIGARLVYDLLEKGYELTVYDIMYFGDHFLPKEHPNLKIIKGDIRDQKKKESSKNHDFFVHLACISNDTSFALDEKLSTSVNLDAFKPMVKLKKMVFRDLYMLLQVQLWSFQ